MSIWHGHSLETFAEVSFLRCDKFVYGSKALWDHFCTERFTLDHIDDLLLRSTAKEAGWQFHSGGGVPSKPAFDYCPKHRVPGPG